MKNFAKKLVLVLTLLLVSVSLTACKETPPTELECNDNEIIENGECVLAPVVDETSPVLYVQDMWYVLGEDDPAFDLAFQAYDETDGNITADIVVDDSGVDYATVGDYSVSVTVSDAAGNESTVTVNMKVVNFDDLSEEDIIALDLAQLYVSYDNMNLVSFTHNGSLVFWETSNSMVVTNRGFIIPPPVGSDPVEVQLTARVQRGTLTGTQSYTIVVEPFDEVEVTSKVSVPFEGVSEEYVVENDSSVAIYYVDNGTVPYMDIVEFIEMLDGAIESDVFTYTQVGDDVLEISYDVEYEDFDGSMVTESFMAIIDFTENTFTVNNYGFFENYISETESDYGEGLEYVDAEYVDPHNVEIPLGEYNFDILMYEDNGQMKYLMPFHIDNLLFAGNIYYDAYFNGDKIWGFSYLLDEFDTPELETAFYNQVRTSSLNGAEMAEDMRWATVNYMALSMDYFYGLKEDKGIDTFKTMMAARASSYLTNSPSVIYRDIFDFAYDLDDLHTSHSWTGYYLAPYELGLSISDLGPRSTSFYEDGIWAVQDLIEAKYGSVEAMPDYELIDNNKTAVIHLTGFTIDTPDEFKAILDSLPSETENVVIDLAYNTGGNLGAVLRIFGYMTEESFAYHSQNPADGSAVTWWIESDYVAYDYNWYIVSSKVTFSAANLMTSMAKELGLATVLGQNSSGGASSIGTLITPDGSMLIISTNNVLSTRVGNEVDGYDYLSIEYGIEPEYRLNNVMSDDQIIAAIAEHQASQTE